MPILQSPSVVFLVVGKARYRNSVRCWLTFAETKRNGCEYGATQSSQDITRSARLARHSAVQQVRAAGRNTGRAEFCLPRDPRGHGLHQNRRNAGGHGALYDPDPDGLVCDLRVFASSGGRGRFSDGRHNRLGPCRDGCNRIVGLSGAGVFAGVDGRSFAVRSADHRPWVCRARFWSAF